MSANRLLILGAVRMLQPVHGHALRRALEEWQADRWTSIAYGSIYHALKTLNDEGFLSSTSASQERLGGISKLTYAITPKGTKEFNRLLSKYWQETSPVYDPFQVALNFSLFLSPKEYRKGLIKRRDHAAATVAELKQRMVGAPPHVQDALRLAIGYNKAFITWANHVLDK